MSRLVTLRSEVKPSRRSRSESESDKGDELRGVDAKLSDLPLARVKRM